MKTFKHSGDLGDIIYSLPTIKDLGGGILYLDVNGGKDDEYCIPQLRFTGGRTKFNLNSFNFIYPLLKIQPYLHDVRIFNNEHIDYNLNKMRQIILLGSRSKHSCLVDSHREAFNLPEYDVNNPWIQCDEVIKLKKDVILSRSPRYQSSYVFLQTLKDLFTNHGIFIGLKKEHELFEWTFDVKVDFYDSNSSLDIAKVIKGSRAMFSNSNFNLALAIGLGHNDIWQELPKHCNITLFPGKLGMKII